MSGIRMAVLGICAALLVACATRGPAGADEAAGRLVGARTLRIAVDDRRGFDLDVATYVANGLNARNIEWIDVFSQDRIKIIEDDEADLVVSAFAITANRLDRISFAGPYIISGQDIAIRVSDAPFITGLASLEKKKVCSVIGSTSVDRLVEEFGKPWDTPTHLVRLESTRQCINELLANRVDAVSTGNMILASYVAEQPGRLRLVGHPFTIDNVGIGLTKGDSRDIVAINNILRKMIYDGTWAASIKKNFGPAAGIFLSNPPTPGTMKPSWSIP
jgi:glutamate transport system substrate-binding protein